MLCKTRHRASTQKTINMLLLTEAIQLFAASQRGLMNLMGMWIQITFLKLLYSWHDKLLTIAQMVTLSLTAYPQKLWNKLSNNGWFETTWGSCDVIMTPKEPISNGNRLTGKHNLNVPFRVSWLPKSMSLWGLIYQHLLSKNMNIRLYSNFLKMQ